MPLIKWSQLKTVAKIGLLCSCMFGCSRTDQTTTGGKSDKKTGVPVTVASVSRRDLPSLVHALGTVEASKTVEVVPQVSGLITEVHFKEGDNVKQGDLLFSVDARPYRASQSMARASLAKARSNAKQAQNEAERARALNKEGLVSAQQLEKARADTEAAEAAVRAEQAQLRSSGINVAFSRILAPLDGKTGTLLVNAGNVVSVSDNQPLVVIRDLSPVYVRFAVPQEHLLTIRKRMSEEGLTVRVKQRGGGDDTVEGPVTFMENSIDASTGTLALKAEFKNDNGGLWPGAAVDVELILGVDKQVVVAPAAAVQAGQKGQFAFVVDKADLAHVRSVQSTRTVGEFTLIRSGLKPGDVVVTDGHVRLRDGAKVEILTPQSETKAQPRDASQDRN